MLIVGMKDMEIGLTVNAKKHRDLKVGEELRLEKLARIGGGIRFARELQSQMAMRHGMTLSMNKKFRALMTGARKLGRRKVR